MFPTCMKYLIRKFGRFISPVLYWPYIAWFCSPKEKIVIITYIKRVIIVIINFHLWIFIYLLLYMNIFKSNLLYWFIYIFFWSRLLHLGRQKIKLEWKQIGSYQNQVCQILLFHRTEHFQIMERIWNIFIDGYIDMLLGLFIVLGVGLFYNIFLLYEE